STITLAGNASDNVGVTKVEFYCDGSVIVGTDTSAPYSVPCNTTTMANGSHSFYCKAYDAAGNYTTSPSTAVTVSNTSTGTPGQLQWAKTGVGSAGTLAPAFGVATDHSGNSVIVGGL